MLSLVNGDLFEIPSLDGIAHGVNAEGKMWSGIALQFRERFPEMHEEYIETCRKAPMAGGLFAYGDEDNFWVYNCFSQDLAGPNAKLDFLESSLRSMVAHAEYFELSRVGLPWIGTGVGALSREDVMEVFEDILEPSTVEFILVDYVPTPAPVVEQPTPSVSLDVVEEVLREHIMEWKINNYSTEFNKEGDLSRIQGWCSCLERVDDYTAHVREHILKVVEA